MRFNKFLNEEKTKKKNIKMEPYGDKDADIKQLHIYLASDDRIEVQGGDEKTGDKSWTGDYYSWMDDNIELTINISGKKTVLKSSYDEPKDKSTWITLKGLKGKMKKMTKYGMSRDVYIINIKTNTADINLSAKAIIEPKEEWK